MCWIRFRKVLWRASYTQIHLGQNYADSLQWRFNEGKRDLRIMAKNQVPFPPVTLLVEAVVDF